MVMLPVIDLTTPAGRRQFADRVGQLRQTTSLAGQYARTAAKVIEAVRRDGDKAIVRQMRKWTDRQFTADRIAVSATELSVAVGGLTGPLQQAIEGAIQHVRAYQSHIMPQAPKPVVIDGAELGLRFTPVDSVGLNVPGGAAVLFSTLIMLAVPGQVAGVKPSDMAVASPPPTRQAGEPAGDISPIVLAVCAMLGIDKVYRIGGPAAFAAMALGTETVRPVDMIAGPSNAFGQAAKAQLAGIVGTDGFYGPSEIVTIADETARAECVAADLIAQAEHAPGKCFLLAWSDKVIEGIAVQIAAQSPRRQRRLAVEAALGSESCAVLVADEAQAIEAADTIAGEHVNLAVADPDRLMKLLRHGGEFFLGDQTPVAAGDYYAGPSHCLPTGGTARFTSGVSVYTFLKRSGSVCYRRGMTAQTAAAIARLAEAEGLDGHVESVNVRGA